MKKSVNATTLNNVCETILKYGWYDFSNPLQVCYRMQDTDLKDTLFGFCVVIKNTSGFAIQHNTDEDGYFDDGDDYSLYDDIILWKFKKGNDKKDKPGLTVWIPTEWTTSKENN